jgi:nucleoside-diphosphate-sugar epimerase
MAKGGRILVTGALGCLGAWSMAKLVRENTFTIGLDVGVDNHRLKYLLTDNELISARIVTGDVTKVDDLDRVVAENGISHILHFAALQVPFCRSDPAAGARVNVVGTANVFEVARRRRDLVQRVIYASSVAVYGPKTYYDAGPVGPDAIMRPATHYGSYKRVNETTGKIYWLDEGVSSICLRPHTVYGVGRDQGLTSGCSKAMLAAAVGKEYRISHGGNADFQLAADVADVFIKCARIDYTGASVHNLCGSRVNVVDVIRAIETVAPELEGRITYDEQTELPFPEALDESTLVDLIGEIPVTPLQDGVGQTVQHFAKLCSSGRIDVPRFLD